MTDPKTKARLNEIGKEIAMMDTKSKGSVIFDICEGKLKGVRTDDKWRPDKN